ncbi:hypothetical protein F4054_20175 [Candidatus Poribacteria bacterium]|nr:hypothetical protein [Candidatus Poribacteria bacterium]MYK24564.1 hypothetical protein [Candidatus Poribacteria bacterium]
MSEKRPQPQISTETTSLLLPLAIGIVLILINAYWIALVSGIHHSLNPAYASLFITPIVNLFFLVLLNTLLKRFRPQLALNRAQLLIVYQMLVMLCLVSGHNPMDFILGILAHPFWFATFENEYAALFHRYIPSWFTIQDKSALIGFFEGNSTLYTAKHLLAWIGPTLLWSFVTFVLFFILMCFNSIQRLQWSERERLSYPIAQLPIEITTPQFFSRRLLWLGFGICAAVEFLNGLHFLYPFIPGVPLKIPDFGAKIFTSKPWSAIGWLPIFFYPWVIGLTFFVPLELSFSVWFFFLFTKFQLILGSIGGWKSLPGFPYYNQQGIGAWLTLGILVLWASRKHLKTVFTLALKPPTSTNEPFQYRTALLGILISTVILVIIFQQAGMSVGILLAFLCLYVLISIAITYARAAVGVPYHEVIWTHPQLMLVSVLGVRRIGASNLTLLSFLYPYVRDNVSHPMPSQLEGFKIAERARLSQKKMAIAMIVALLVATPVSFWAYLHLMYQHGAVQSEGYIIGIGIETFERLLLPWLQQPHAPDSTGLSFTAFASLFTLGLMFLRKQFIWFPFHPAGYALGLSAGMVWGWSAVCVGWFIKAVLLKFGGLRTYRKAAPFFVGVILGDFLTGTFWSLVGAVFEIPVYRVWY